MKTNIVDPTSAHRHLVRVAAACGLLLFLAFVNAGSARASYEQVKTFGEQNMELFHGSGTAINTTGAGGVPAGTVYIVAKNSASVARYSPQGEFREAWGFGVADAQQEEYQRCGPDGEAIHPTCAPVKAGAQTESEIGLGRGGENLGQLSTPAGVAVDQATGNVYVFNVARQKGVVQVFSADGSQRLGGFGEYEKPRKFPEPQESIEKGPDKFHIFSTSVYGSKITVDQAGTVYIQDLEGANPDDGATAQESRVMVFEPETPGDYGHYVYAGRDHDLKTEATGPIASDYAGHVYVSNDNSIREFDPPSTTPICTFPLSSGGITAMTADPATGEVYYFNEKKKDIHRLVCSGGKFVDTESFQESPKQQIMFGFAFNPTTSFDANRPPGILYALDPTEEVPGKGAVGVAHVFAPGAVLNPTVESQAASEVGIEGAALHATINPRGAATTYAFQYISDAAYQENEPGERFAGAVEIPSAGGQLQSGIAGIPVGVVLSGLQPGTQYHFRVVANNCSEGQEVSLCTTEGEEDTFRTFPAGAGRTPDNRVYEMVSPAQKNGGQVYPANTPLFTPSCLECKPGRVGTKFPRITSPDGETVAYEGDPFSFTEGAPNDDAYVSVRTAAGWQTTTLNPVRGGSGSEQGVVGYDRALSKGVLYQGHPSLTTTAPSEVPNLYTLPTVTPGLLSPVLTSAPPNLGDAVTLAYAGGSSDLEHIFFAANDALTGETPYAPAAEFQSGKSNLYEYFEGSLRLVNVLPGNTETAAGSVFGGLARSIGQIKGTADAISEDGSSVFWSDPSGQVYVRENGTVTRELSDHSGRFLAATGDGSKVLLDDGNLIDLADGESTVDLAQGQGGFLGIAGQSEDLSSVYLVDTAVLDGTPNSEGASAIAGKANLYLWDEGATSYIATLNSQSTFEERRNWADAPVERTASASPNGRWLTFTSAAPLLGQDNVGPCGGRPEHGEFESRPCTDIYLYDAAAGKLRCPSCSPTEEGTLGKSHLAQFNFPPGSTAQSQQRYITDAGRLFFDSPNRLSPADTNDGAEDVYEYEPDGVGTCGEDGGCVSLVSAGDEFTDANLLMIDPSGKNAFFTTREQLSLRDKDELFDLYVARENGGIPGETETTRSECQGEACQPPIVVPSDPTPGSSTFQGAGNVREKAAKKSKKHKKHHKKHKKRHHKQKKNHNNNGGGAK
jgi:DNA-binding beta-propeller fold protein YncE